MDTSETYIKMADCPEIQDIGRTMLERNCNRWEDIGSWFFDKDLGDLICIGSIGADWKFWKEKSSLKNVIWLPTQDQLSPMSNLTWMDYDRKCAEIQEHFGWLSKGMAGIMVVMKEKHGNGLGIF